jgi:hypothetical protein
MTASAIETDDYPHSVPSDRFGLPIVSFPYQPRPSPPNAHVPTQPRSVPTQINPPTAIRTGFPYRSLSWADTPRVASLAAEALVVGGGYSAAEIRRREV